MLCTKFYSGSLQNSSKLLSLLYIKAKSKSRVADVRSTPTHLAFISNDKQLPILKMNHHTTHQKKILKHYPFLPLGSFFFFSCLTYSPPVSFYVMLTYSASFIINLILVWWEKMEEGVEWRRVVKNGVSRMSPPT